jgi:hypothetical protein
MTDARAATIAAYQADAAAYAAGTGPMPESVARDMEEFVERVGVGARVLEIGSGLAATHASSRAAGSS